jgi:hypothetical protein
MYIVMLIHHPKFEYVDEFLAFVTRVATIAQGSSGMLEFGS